MTDDGIRGATHQNSLWPLALIGLALLVAVLLGPSLHRSAGDLAFNALGVAHGLLVLLAVRLAGQAESRRVLLLIICIGVLLRLALLFVHPHLSSDAFRYVWDGRVQGEGINPYRFVPAAAELAYLRDAAIYPFINRADYAVTIYPPAAQMLFFLIGRIWDGMVAMKLGLIALEGLTVVILIDLLRRIGQPTTRIVAYLWHPLAVWEIAGSAHVDAAMLAVMMLGIWIVAVQRRRIAGAAVLAVAVLMKPLAIFALPFAWRRWDWRAPAAAIGVALLLYLPYLSVGTGVFSFVGGYLEEENIESGEAFWLVALVTSLTGPLPWLRWLYLGGGAALLLWLAFRLAAVPEEDPELRLRRLGWIFLAGLLVLSPGYPWYNLCLLPFVVLFGMPPFWAATIGCYLLYNEIPGDPEIPFWIRDGAMNIAVYGGLLWMAWRVRRPATPAPRQTAT